MVAPGFILQRIQIRNPFEIGIFFILVRNHLFIKNQPIGSSMLSIIIIRRENILTGLGGKSNEENQK
jgi:hypothetical protein